MRTLLSSIGRAFIFAFAGTFFVFASGLLSAPNFDAARSIGIAATGASIVAGFNAVQVYVPKLTVAHWIGQPAGAWADAFVHGFLGSILITLPGALDAPDLATARAIAVSALAGALTAGARGLEGALTPGETPIPRLGVPEPPPQA
jgi:hypothetical protein